MSPFPNFPFSHFPPGPVPIFLRQPLLSDVTGERARLAVRGGNPPIRLLPSLKIDGSERDLRVLSSTEIAVDPISRDNQS